MKKILVIIMTAMFVTGTGIAQKFAFVDTEYILDRIPSYKSALDQLDKISEDYQKEIEGMYTQVEQLFKAYQKEHVLLTDEQKISRQDAIEAKEREIKELQKKYFGADGAVFQKRQELVKPIQDEVYKAVKELALEGGYAVIFDTASGSGILYENPKYNMSDDILEKLGYKN